MKARLSRLSIGSISVIAGVFALSGALVLSQCEHHATTGPDQYEDAAVVDTQLLAFLSLARAHHHEANLKEQAGDVSGAIDALEQIVSAPKPHAGTTIPEVEEVLADTYARIAELRLSRGDTDGAKQDVESGLVHATEPTYFRGHLLEVYGIIEEQRTAKLTDAGSTDEAAKARAHALSLLKQAVDIQEKVIGHVLDASSPTSAGDGGGASRWDSLPYERGRCWFGCSWARAGARPKLRARPRPARARPQPAGPRPPRAARITGTRT